MPDSGTMVVGAGAVGLPIASRLAHDRPDLLVLDRHLRRGTEAAPTMRVSS